MYTLNFFQNQARVIVPHVCKAGRYEAKRIFESMSAEQKRIVCEREFSPNYDFFSHCFAYIFTFHESHQYLSIG